MSARRSKGLRCNTPIPAPFHEAQPTIFKEPAKGCARLIPLMLGLSFGPRENVCCASSVVTTPIKIKPRERALGSGMRTLTPWQDLHSLR